VEATQVASLFSGARARAILTLSFIATIAALSSCASAPPPVPAPVVLATRCVRGPFCVTGEVDDQFSAAVEGVKCIALNETGSSTTVLSDARGVFFMDGLTSLPRQVRFEKTGFNSQTVAVLPVAAGSAAPVYVIFHRIADSECSCEPAAIMAGHDPCPDEKCGRSRFDVTIPENPTPRPPPSE
jgi:Carboxypeptidase regulatory-like domain